MAEPQTRSCKQVADLQAFRSQPRNTLKARAQITVTAVDDVLHISGTEPSISIWDERPLTSCGGLGA